MSKSFDAAGGLIIVPVTLHGPDHSTVVRLALDTGATGTLINQAPLLLVGYDPSLAPKRVQLTTGSGVEFAPLLPVLKISALGCSREHFPVLAHTLPPSATVDGLLGLDFFRGTRLEIDFREGSLNLNVRTIRHRCTSNEKPVEHREIVPFGDGPNPRGHRNAQA